MPPLKRLFGTVVLVAFVLFYGLTVMDIGNIVIATKSKTTQLIFFVLAGLAWVVPAGALIWWMYRPKKAKAAPEG